MDLILKSSGGQNIVLRPQARPAWYAEATVDAQEVELFLQETDPATGALVGAPKLVGRFAADAKVVIPHTPTADRNVRVYAVPYAADGTPGYSDLRHAEQATVLFQRETDAPTVTQAGEATQTQVTLLIGGYSQFALRRKVRVADNEDMTGAAETVTEATGAGLSRTVVIHRADTETEAQTIWVRVSHSSSAAGAFGAESAAQDFTFADDMGAGGSSGDGDPFGREQIPY
jgi:hypothetical protein